jgi:hypothetical protein
MAFPLWPGSSSAGMIDERLAQGANERSVYSGNYAAVAQSGHYSNIYVDTYPGVHVTISRGGGVHVNVFIGNYW